MGAPGVSVPNTLRAPRASVDEVSGGSSMKPKSTSERGSEKPWSRGQVQLLKQGVRHVREAIAALTMVAKQDSVPHYRVLEIFGGSAALSLVARSTGQWVALEPVDLMYGSDLLSPQEQRSVLEQIDVWEPDLVCLEPPCGPWSSLQALNDAVVVDFKRAMHMPFWIFCAKVWKKQDDAGRLVLLEQPLRSAALQLGCMSRRSHVFRAIVDQCQFDLRDPLNHKLFRKRTALDVNSEVFAAALMQGAKCGHQPHEHQPIEGQTLCDGKWVSRSLVAGTWTSSFGKHILSCAALALAHGSCWYQRLGGVQSFVADFEEDPRAVQGPFLALASGEGVCRQHGRYEHDACWCAGCHGGYCPACISAHVCEVLPDVVRVGDPLSYSALAVDADQGWLQYGTGPEDLRTSVAINSAFRQLQRDEDERRGDFGGIGSRYGYIKFVGVSLRIPKIIRNQVAKLHGTLGHPSNDRLARMLHLQGAQKEVVQAAKDLRCEICSRAHAPQTAPKSSSTAAERFNQHVSSDSFFFLDADGRRWNMTHLVDGFCSLQTAILSRNPSSAVSSEMLFERWVLIYGPMKKLAIPESLPTV